MARRATRLTESERRIWEAAYAAAWVRLFYDEVALRHRLNNGGFDEAMRAGHAEEAEDVAAGAIADLRRWRTEGAWPTNHERGAPKLVDMSIGDEVED